MQSGLVPTLTRAVSLRDFRSKTHTPFSRPQLMNPRPSAGVRARLAVALVKVAKKIEPKEE